MQKFDNHCVELNDYLHEYGDLSTEPIIACIFGLFYTIIIAAGLTGNACVIIAVIKNRSLQTVPNMFIFSLSCSDILVCCFSATITPIAAFEKRWIFGAFLCKSVPFFMGITLCFSTFTLAAISIDRFLLIKYPVKKMLTKHKALLIILFNCVLAALFSSPVIFEMGLIDGRNLTETTPICGEFCDEVGWKKGYGRRIYGTVLLCVQFVVPFLIIFFCYSSILRTVKQGMHTKVGQNTYEWQPEMTSQQRAVLRRRQRTNRMLISMVVAFSASWIGNILFHTFKDYDILPEFIVNQEVLYAIAAHCIAMTSTVWNPLLYAVLNLQFREAFLNLLPSKFTRDESNLEAATPLTQFANMNDTTSYKKQKQKKDSREAGKRVGFSNGNCIYKFSEKASPTTISEKEEGSDDSVERIKKETSHKVSAKKVFFN